MVNLEIKTYSCEQIFELTRFKRAARIIASLNEHQKELDGGITAMIPDPDQKGHYVALDKIEARVIRGAVGKMFDICLNLDLLEELK